MTDIDRMEIMFSELCKIAREKFDSLSTEKHNLTIDLIDAQKKRDQFREVLAAIVNSRHPDPDLTALARELVAPPRGDWEVINETAKQACGVRG